MSRRSTLLFGWGLAMAAMAAFVALGAWQLGRMHDKRALLAAARTTLHARVEKPLAVAADPGRGRDYDWSTGEGAYAHAPAVLLDNQQRGGRPGLRVYRLFLPQAADAAPLLVDLGWLPVPGDRRIPVIAPPPSATRVAGLLAPPPSPGLVAAALQPQSDGNLLTPALDLDILRAELDTPALAPRVLRLDPQLPGGYARDLEVLPNTLPPERHLGYAVQWYGLALAVLVTALVLTFRRRRPRPQRK